jgi:hypothetical protein
MHNLLYSEYLSPDDGNGSVGGEETDTFELLSEEPEEVLEIGKTDKGGGDDDEEEEKDKEDKEDKEDEEDELKEIEEELEGPKEEDLELTTPVRRKEILAKYPKLFKDFPYLEKAYYREQQFTEVFPTVQEAKTAVEKSKVIDQLERELLNGDITSVLRAARQENQESFHRIADNYLGALRSVDQQAYYHVLGNVVKDTIITMVREARNLGEQGAPLQAAANILNQFVFGSQNFKPPTTLAKQVRPEDQNREQEFQQREYQRVMSSFESTKDDLQTRADNVLKSTIDQHIDPNGTMTGYVKKNATKDAFDSLETLISKDARFRGLLDKLWEKAFQSNFDKDTTDKIKAAYLSKAKTLLPSVIKKARNEALKGLGGRRNGSEEREREKEKDSETSTVKRSPSGSPRPPSGGKIRKPSDIPKGMSTLDVFMKD